MFFFNKIFFNFHFTFIYNAFKGISFSPHATQCIDTAPRITTNFLIRVICGSLFCVDLYPTAEVSYICAIFQIDERKSGRIQSVGISFFVTL